MLHINKIENLAKYAFVDLPSLNFINLNGNRLKSIHIETFINLSSLTDLFLSENEIEYIEENSFAGTPHLEHLDIRFNKIRFLQSGLFNSLNRLQELDLFRNEITSVKKNTFDGLTNLTILSLQTNKIEIIPSELFANLLLLERLDISYNRLIKIEKSAFKNLKSLANLNMRNNYLESLVDVFDGVIQLSILDLRFNFIKIFENSFTFAVEEIILEYNALKIIKSNSASLSFIKINLVILKLGFNDLSLIENENFFNFAALKHLFVNSNRFKLLQDMKLEYLHSLETIDISFNLSSYMTQRFLI